MAKGKKDGDKPEYLEPEEMAQLMDVVSGDLYYTTLYKVLRYSGRRIGEIYGTVREKKLTGGMLVGDVETEKMQMTTIILKTKHRNLQVICLNCKLKSSHKNKFCNDCGQELPKIDPNNLKYAISKKITIPMRPELPVILDTYIRKNKLKAKDYMFREVPLVTLKKKIKEHAKLAGIKKNFSLHGFRHYFITRCKIAGMSNEDIAKWTGHVLPSTLNIYDSRVPNDVRSKIEDVEL